MPEPTQAVRREFSGGCGRFSGACGIWVAVGQLGMKVKGQKRSALTTGKA